MSAPVEIRCFLHCNYNCRDLDALERYYIEVFGLKAVMRSAGRGNDGTPFGIYGELSSDTSFLYDHRGGRRANALEIVQWIEPPTIGAVYPNGWDRGIQSVAYTAADLDRVAATSSEFGGMVVERGEGWLLLRDPEGVAIEVFRAEGPSEARYLRIVCSDVERAAAWWAVLGFTDAPHLIAAPGASIWAADGEHAVVEERAIVATDDRTFGIVLTGWSGPPPAGPTYAVPYHQGIYRIAIAVDDVQAAFESLLEQGIARQPPYTFQLPGTKLTAGLTIMFIRDPDGILVELVERPRLPR